MTIEVIPVPLLRDNYAYLIADRAAGTAVVIDPSEADPVLDALASEGLDLAGIWCTHHHWDHVGGIAGLLRDHPSIPVLGSEHDLAQKNIEHQTRGLRDQDVVQHGGVSFEVLAIPGHTLGAIAYVGGGDAFTGDTLFLGGCGRVFEGTMPMMRASLARLRALAPETHIWCGHEYTQKNLEFARVIEPQESAIRARLDAVSAARTEGRPTIPGTIAEEKTTNPFFRWDAPAVRKFAESRGPAATDDEIFARLREAKDSF
ncbi:MAG: hydroxyacylglutathione hydrolase [Myxococcota bacterium]|nr:hydroxyacylglutathione hydrolase [Myxococcota bacterium]